MTTVLKLPIQSLDDAVLRSIREKYPEAVVQIEAEQATDEDIMDESRFWDIIDRLDWQQRDRAQVVKPALESLSRFPVESIEAFHDIMAEKLFALDARRFAVQLGSNRYTDSGDNYFSPDDFLYSRCGVVARGKTYYDMVLQNPARMPKEFTFEQVLYLPRRAYELKTGLDDYDHVSDTWYETFSNPNGWPGVTSLKDIILAS